MVMSNGTDEAKAAADRVIGDVREDGLAALIEELWFDGPKAEPSTRWVNTARAKEMPRSPAMLCLHKMQVLAPPAGSHPPLRWTRGHCWYPETGVPLATL